jgi:TRAP-type C4-dicarboxylate transport system permease large subunit
LTSTTHKKNLAAAIITAISLLLYLLGSFMTEGSYIVITKPMVLAIASASGLIARLVGEVVRHFSRDA